MTVQDRVALYFELDVTIAGVVGLLTDPAVKSHRTRGLYSTYRDLEKYLPSNRRDYYRDKLGKIGNASFRSPRIALNALGRNNVE